MALLLCNKALQNLVAPINPLITAHQCKDQASLVLVELMHASPTSCASADLGRAISGTLGDGLV